MKCLICKSNNGRIRANTHHESNPEETIYICDKCWIEYLAYIKEKNLSEKPKRSEGK